MRDLRAPEAEHPGPQEARHPRFTPRTALVVAALVVALVS